MKWWLETSLYDRCCGERPRVSRDWRMSRHGLRRRYVAACPSCGAEATASHAIDALTRWNQMQRGIRPETPPKPSKTPMSYACARVGHSKNEKSLGLVLRTVLRARAPLPKGRGGNNLKYYSPSLSA